MRRRHHWDPICDPPRALARPVPVDPTGVHGPTKSQAHRAGGPGSPWRRTTPGRYVPSTADAAAPEQRVLEMHELLHGRGAVTGWGALRAHGANFFDGLAPDGVTRLPVVLVTGPRDRRRPRPGVRWRQDRLDDGEVVIRLGMRVTRPERATFDAMRLAPDVREAVVAVEMAIAAELTSLRRMRDYVEAHSGWDGVLLVREALDLACEHSRSPAESRMGLLWVRDAGLPRPLINCEVFSLGGRLLGVADLLDLEAGVVGEYDGGDHSGARRRSQDAVREAGLRDHGLEVFRVTGYDLLDPSSVVRRMRAARARARWEPVEQRRWTIEPPPGWARSVSIDELLDERDIRRESAEAWAREQSQ
ncbi:MAG: hypothetical protein ACTHKG_15110 [Nocardioides sp.]